MKITFSLANGCFTDFFKYSLFIMYMYMSMCVQACICEHRCLRSPEEDIRSLGAILEDICELSQVGAGN